MKLTRNVIVAALATVVVSAPLAMAATRDVPAAAAGAAASPKGRTVEYRGKTSSPRPNRFGLSIKEGKDGQRRLTEVEMSFTLTCEDGETERWGASFGWWPGAKVDREGNFTFTSAGFFASEFLQVTGTALWKRASGTFVFKEARLTDDHEDAQVCETGDLTWKAERAGSRPRTASDTTPPGAGFMRIDVRDGVARVVERREPA
jgi:hypothetical protein